VTIFTSHDLGSVNRRCARVLHLERLYCPRSVHRHIQDASFSPILVTASFSPLFVPRPNRDFAYRFFYHSSPPPKAASPSIRKDEIPHITIIRPTKGLEPGLYECLASTFRQEYPREKMTLYLCVSSTQDPAYPVLQKVVSDFPNFDAKVMVEEHDPVLHGTGGNVNSLGPNPKIRNISRAYREAKGEIIWIVDCNVWLSKGVAGRMIDKLCGFRPDGTRAKPYKFVHQLPLVVDIGGLKVGESQNLLTSDDEDSFLDEHAYGGNRLEEMFMATTHAKFYSAINTVSIAPCIVGKSNMFRKSHLDALTDPAQNPILQSSDASRGRGIDFFSSYICEDHLIGDLLWRSSIPGHRNHGLVSGDLAIQPVGDMNVAAYVGRRVRWLRVRKWTVLLATLVEPGVEAFLCSAYFSFGITTFPWFHERYGVPQTWSCMSFIWLAAVTTWMCVDRIVYSKLHRRESVEVDENTPVFARGTARKDGMPPKKFAIWLLGWLGREALALPIWTWAVLLGATVVWRGKTFKVRMDMSVVEIEQDAKTRELATGQPSVVMSRSRSKDRVD
jgi:ceramide glucosyltransferase